MAQFVVRNVDDDIAEKLKKRARRRGRSMEEEVRHILRDAVRADDRGVRRLGTRIVARFAKEGLSADLPELHGPARPADVDS